MSNPLSYLQKHYAPGSPDRRALEEALARTKQSSPLTVPLVIAGKEVSGRQIPHLRLRLE